MPTYVYETVTASGHDGARFEVRQGMAEAPLTHHPETGVPVRRVLSGGLATFTGGAAGGGVASMPSGPMGGGMGCGAGCACA